MTLRATTLVVGALLGAVTAGCSCEGPRIATQVIVVIDADDVVRGASSDLGVEIFGGPAEGPPAFPDDPKGTLTFRVAEGSGWPRTFALAPESRDPSRLYRVVATASSGTTTVAVARVISGYVPGTVRTVRLFLSAACDSPCERTETCDPLLEMCVPAEIDPDDLPEYVADGGALDGGGADVPSSADAGSDTPTTVDGGHDAGSLGDGGMDAPIALDVGSDPFDGGFDGGFDAGLDGGGGVDGGFDAGRDAGRDAGSDAGRDAGRDTGVDAPIPFDTGNETGPDAGGSIDAPLSFGDSGGGLGGGLTINEVDYFGGGDFVEVVNLSASPAPLTAYVLQVVSLPDCTLVTTINMTGTLASGGYRAELRPLPDAGFGVVLQSMTGVVDRVAFLPTGDTAVCTVSGRLVTFVGEAAAEGSAGESVGRNPDGLGGFRVCAPSPSSPNVCP